MKTRPDSRAHPEADVQGDADVQDAASVLNRMLSGRGGAPRGGAMADALVTTWAGTSGTLGDGRVARLGASCLVRPTAGDHVLIWSSADNQRWVLAVLDRQAPANTVLGTDVPLVIEAPTVAVTAGAVHIQAQHFLTSTRNRHAVERVRTESVRTRVAQVGTDIRRASHATDEIEGTFLQRTGSWLSNTVREARLHARAFLFD